MGWLSNLVANKGPSIRGVVPITLPTWLETPFLDAIKLMLGVVF